MPEASVPPSAARFAAGSSPAELLASMPYAAALSISLNEVTPQLVRGSLDWSPERCTASGVMHGGAGISLADNVASGCGPLNLPPGAGPGPGDCGPHVFLPGPEGTLTA